MVKRPIAVCFFDDGGSYGDKKWMSQKDILVRLQESEFNLDIAHHVLDVSVTRNIDGNIVGSISLDNEASRYTTKLFNRVFSAYTEGEPEKKTFLSEGLGVVVYMGYYTSIGDWGQIVKKVDGIIDAISFSFQQNGTPQLVLSISDAYTFMGNPRMRNTELTMQPDDSTQYIPIRSAYPYSSVANGTAVDLAIGVRQEITGAQTSSHTLGAETDGTLIGGGQTYSGDTAPNLYSKASKTVSPKKKKSKFKISHKVKAVSIFAETVGIRDSQAVLLIVQRYNEMIDKMYPLKDPSARKQQGSPLLASSPSVLENKKALSKDEEIEGIIAFNDRADAMRKRLKIKGTFVIMTGEGGNKYSTMSAFDPRSRGNKIAHPVNLGFSDLLLSLASKHHFDVFVKDQILFFMPPVIKKTADFTYYYGASKEDVPRVLSFTPSLSQVQLGVDFHAYEFNPDNGLVEFLRSQFTEDLDKAIVYVLAVDPDNGGEPIYYTVNGETTGKDAAEKAQKELSKLMGSDYISMSYFSSGTEEVIKGITETESDVINADIELEGNPFLEIGMTLGIRGLDGEKNPVHKRFDANYRVTEITDHYSGVYKTTVKTMTRALQGVTAASDSNNDHFPYIGLWASNLLLEPSIVWASRNSPYGERVVLSLQKYLGSVQGTKGTNIKDASFELQCLLANKNVSFADDQITGKHTIVQNAEAGISEGDENVFSSIADKIPCLTYEKAFEILGYGEFKISREADPKLDFSQEPVNANA